MTLVNHCLVTRTKRERFPISQQPDCELCQQFGDGLLTDGLSVAMKRKPKRPHRIPDRNAEIDGSGRKSVLGARAGHTGCRKADIRPSPSDRERTSHPVGHLFDDPRMHGSVFCQQVGVDPDDGVLQLGRVRDYSAENDIRRACDAHQFGDYEPASEGLSDCHREAAIAEEVDESGRLSDWHART